MDAAGYDPGYKKWRYDDLPILPEPFRYVLVKDKADAFQNLKRLMDREDVTELVNACDAGREGELIFRLVYEMAGCTKPFSRLWISSMEDAAIREGFADLRPGAEYDPLYQSALCRPESGLAHRDQCHKTFFCSLPPHPECGAGADAHPCHTGSAGTGRSPASRRRNTTMCAWSWTGPRRSASGSPPRRRRRPCGRPVPLGPAVCTSVTREQKKEAPPKLYDLTTLQREANRVFGYTAKQTLDYAQSLYEKKLLTYPRTDSRYLTADMAETASAVHPPGGQGAAL